MIGEQVTSKTAVIGMVKTWGKELGRNRIRSAAVCPGLIDTPILAHAPDKILEALKQKLSLGRLGSTEEIANVFAFLASDEASYITASRSRSAEDWSREPRSQRIYGHSDHRHLVLPVRTD